jgi:hypothetical protein
VDEAVEQAERGNEGGGQRREGGTSACVEKWTGLQRAYGVGRDVELTTVLITTG